MDSLERILPRLITPLGATLLACLPISPVALSQNRALLSFTPGLPPVMRWASSMPPAGRSW